MLIKIKVDYLIVVSHHLQGWAAVAAALGQLGYAMPAAPAATAAPAPVTAPAPAAPETDPLASVLASLGLGNINLGALNNLDLSSLSSIPGLESLASIPGLESLFPPATGGMGTVAPGIVPSRSRGKGKAPKGKSFGKGKPLTQDPGFSIDAVAEFLLIEIETLLRLLDTSDIFRPCFLQIGVQSNLKARIYRF